MQVQETFARCHILESSIFSCVKYILTKNNHIAGQSECFVITVWKCFVYILGERLMHEMTTVRPSLKLARTADGVEKFKRSCWL